MVRGWTSAAMLAALFALAPTAASAAPAGSTLLVSRPSGQGPVPPAFDNDSSTPGGLSADGRYAVFTSQADGFVPGTNPGVENVLMRDRSTNQTILISRSDGSGGVGANSDSLAPAIAIAPPGVMPTPPDNKPHVLVTFASQATNLVDHVTGQTVPSGPLQTWMRDVTAGTTTLVSRADGMTGAPVNLGGVDNDWPSPIVVAPGGPVVAFFSNANNLPGGGGGVFLRSVNAGETELVSCQNADCSGTPKGVNAFEPALVLVGSSGLTVAFDSNDSSLTGDLSGHEQVLEANVTAPMHPGDGAGEPSSFLHVSVDSTDHYGNGDSVEPSLSPDGRAVAFMSTATNLTADTLPANPREAYLHTFHPLGETLLLSRASGSSGAAANQQVRSVHLGGSVTQLRAVFFSVASNLGRPRGDVGQTYVRDLNASLTAPLDRASGATGVLGNGSSGEPTISADGSTAMFTSDSRNLGDGASGDFNRVRARSLPMSNVGAGKISLISRPSGTAPFQSLTNSSFGGAQSVSSNGRYVAFDSASASLPGANQSGNDLVYVRDLLENRTVLVSRATGAHGAVADGSTDDTPVISTDGRFVAFESTATNLSPAARNGKFQVYVRDLVKNTTTLVSRASGPRGRPAGDGAFIEGISADGHAVLIESASALDPAGAGGIFHLYLRNRTTDTTTLVDRDNGANGAAAAQEFDRAAIDADGSRVAFSTRAPLAGSPADGVQRVFLRDLKAGTTILVSRADGAAGAPTNSDSLDVAIDGAGDEVAFSSYAQNLGATFVNQQIFLRQLTTSHTQLVSNLSSSPSDLPGAAGSPSLDAGGDRVSFLAVGTSLEPNTELALVRDLSAQAPVVASRAKGADGAPANGDTSSASLDATGNCLAFTTASSNLGDGFASLDFNAVHLRVLRGQCPLPPVLSKLSITPQRVGEAGARIGFTLNEPVSVTLRFIQRMSGRRHGHKCLLRATSGQRCTVTKQRGKLSVSGHQGANHVHLGGTRLMIGRYRLMATLPGGQPRSVAFTVRG